LYGSVLLAFHILCWIDMAEDKDLGASQEGLGCMACGSPNLEFHVK
jgi:hypothetical protein